MEEKYPVSILLLSKADVSRLITWKDVWETVEEVFQSDGRGDLIVPKKDPIRMDDGRSMLLAMPGYLRDQHLAGLKWMRSYPHHPDGLPQLWGQLMILSDSDTGLPYAVMDATEITAMRTAGGHAVVAAKHLARKDSRVLCVLGSGAQALAGIQSFDEAFSLETIRVYSPHVLEKAGELREKLPGLRAKLELCGSVEALYDGCDILLAASSNRGKPLLDVDRIPEGCFVDSMTSFYETGTDILRRTDKWVLGHRLSDRMQIIQDAAFQGRVSEDAVYGTLGEIAAGKLEGRGNEREIILYTHMGMGAFDIAVGKRLYEKAVKQGVGTSFRLI